MPPSPHWSSGSARFRLEWRPSRWLAGALLALSLAAPFAVIASGMPQVVAWPLAAAAWAWGLAGATREWRRPGRRLHWPPPGAVVQWRGPLLFVRGPGLRLSWWPDTLDAPTRRELHRREDRGVAP